MPSFDATVAEIRDNPAGGSLLFFDPTNWKPPATLKVS
jgi:hypothetical protein